MGWVRVDDAFYDHPKFGEAGPMGIALWITALAWANRNLTDGFIPEHRIKLLLSWDGVAWNMWTNGLFGGGEDVSPELVAKHLVAVGLWAEAPGGYQIHDYLEYQPSAAAISGKRNKDRDRKRKGEVESAAAVSSPPPGFRPDSTRIPRGIPPDSAVQEPQPQPQPAASCGGERARTRKIPLDSDGQFVVDDALTDWVRDQYPDVDWERETAKFVHHALDNDRRSHDWSAAWKSWIGKAPRFAR